MRVGYNSSHRIASHTYEMNINKAQNGEGRGERWRGGEVERWGGGEVERWRGGEVERWRSGAVER